MNDEQLPPFVPTVEVEDEAQVRAALLPQGQAELGLDEAMQLALRMHRENRFDGARTLYLRILEQVPGHADALGMLGVMEHQLGRSESGLAYMKQALEVRPDAAGLHLNRGNVLVQLRRFEEALDSFQVAAGLEPESADIHNNIGAVQRAMGQADKALASYQRAIELDPKHVRGWNNLGLWYSGRGEHENAVKAYLTAIDLVPGHGNTAYLLAMTYYKTKEYDKATEVFRQWMMREPDNPVPAHLYAAGSGEQVPQRASDQYVEAEFDSFAGSFERVLNEYLHYRAPQLCADLMATLLGPPQGQLDLLDAGCGTGLCGPLVAPWARRLVGVDLSAGMLAHARSKGVYHKLVKAELTAYLAATPDSWDTMVCADTLCYFGDLTEFMGVAARSLRPGGVLVYTVEALADDTMSTAAILPSGRYAHGRAHLDQVCAAAGLTGLTACREELRKEAGSPVNGWLVAVRRPA